jgi:hypothetical protein
LAREEGRKEGLEVYGGKEGHKRKEGCGMNEGYGRKG